MLGSVFSVTRTYILLAFNSHRVRKIAMNGEVTTLAGTGEGRYRDGPASQACFYRPSGVCVDSSQNVYVADLSK
jgi:hypothetical protein